MCTTQKAKVIRVYGKTATVKILISGSERDIAVTRPVKVNDIVEVFQGTLI